MSVDVGFIIPSWEMPSVSADKMKTMAAILRDPNPLHWDRNAVDALPFNLGQRTINQGPLGLSYIINMLFAWQGVNCIKQITMQFPQVVLDGEQVIASGTVTALSHEDNNTFAHYDVCLSHHERGVLLEGTAKVLLQH